MKQRMLKEQLSVRFPINLSDEIHRKAEEENKSVNQVINDLVEKAFKKGRL